MAGDPAPGEADGSAAESLAAACGSRPPGPGNALSAIDHADTVEGFRTWAGPDGYCEYRLPPRRAAETATAYYVRAILPERVRREKRIGYPSHSELDVDCITAVFSDAEIQALARSRDPVSEYISGLRTVRLGCAEAPSALPQLLSAGRARLPVGMPVKIKRERLAPEALYVAAAVLAICQKDPDGSHQLRIEAAAGGYSWALPPTY